MTTRSFPGDSFPHICVHSLNHRVVEVLYCLHVSFKLVQRDGVSLTSALNWPGNMLLHQTGLDFEVIDFGPHKERSICNKDQ